ncbi:MAG: phospholipase D-like domain-containing protein [Nocardioides sp.]|nr:phospholipase D-like domain-containing protein [Nocardioides sp.]
MAGAIDPARWLLTREERGNPDTSIDDLCEAGTAWIDGNLVTPLVDGSDYFADLVRVIEATEAGDLVLFTDWQGNADELLSEDPERRVVDLLGEADERGVDVRGLVWRSHTNQAGFFAPQNRHLGEQLQARGAQVLLDMRVRRGGSHHQKLVVVRHRDDPTRDVAWLGGIDLAHNRRDDSRHHGDPQGDRISSEYGPRPPWHDVQARIQGPAVHAVETVFRERWEDPTPVTLSPWRWAADRLRGLDTAPAALPDQLPAPPVAGPHRVQLLRTYPSLGLGRDFAFARGGERSVARGYTKALAQARRLVYVEDQYFWGTDVGELFRDALVSNPRLRLVVVVPLHPDVEGTLLRPPQMLARVEALLPLMQAAPGRVAAYALENEAGTPVYVHAKVCIIDDVWASVGSDNFNRRSWTHDSELGCAVLDHDLSLSLRLRLAAEHLGRLDRVEAGEDLRDVVADCLDPEDAYDTYFAAAAAVDAWHRGGRQGDRPAGRLRSLPLEPPPRGARLLTKVPLKTLHDPDGRPARWRGSSHY